MLVEINKLTIILAERLHLKDLVSKRFRSKYTGEMVSVERKTPTILSDADTAQFMKYYLHKRVKAHCYEDFKYEEILSLDQVNKFRGNLPKKTDIQDQLDAFEKRQVLKRQHELEIIEAWEGQVNDMDQYVNSTVTKLEVTPCPNSKLFEPVV